MTPAVVSRAFDPFFTTKPLGTGLGLSMIYGVVRQSGGLARIYTEIGRVKTLHLYFPRCSTDARDTDHPIQAASDTGSAQSDETVLVVDDEPTIRLLIAEVLAEAFYGILEAQEGPGGLAWLDSTAPIDRLITDVGLSDGINGRRIADAARMLRPDCVCCLLWAMPRTLPSAKASWTPVGACRPNLSPWTCWRARSAIYRLRQQWPASQLTCPRHHSCGAGDGASRWRRVAYDRGAARLPIPGFSRRTP